MAGAVTGAWLGELANEIRAEVAAKFVEVGKWVFEEAWKAWSAPTDELSRKQNADGYAYMGRTVYGHVIPGTTLVSYSRGAGSEDKDDRMGCVRDSGESIALESWAWKSVLAFIKHEVGAKEGDDRLHLLQLLATTLMPHGPASSGATPKETMSWVGYPARDGDVEIIKFAESGKAKVTITASGYFTASHGTSTKLTFDLI